MITAHPLQTLQRDFVNAFNSQLDSVPRSKTPVPRANCSTSKRKLFTAGAANFGKSEGCSRIDVCISATGTSQRSNEIGRIECGDKSRRSKNFRDLKKALTIDNHSQYIDVHIEIESVYVIAFKILRIGPQIICPLDWAKYGATLGIDLERERQALNRPAIKAVEHEEKGQSQRRRNGKAAKHRRSPSSRTRTDNTTGRQLPDLEAFLCRTQDSATM
jgi:hypothetical protein